MATTRIKDLSKTATTVNSDANLVLDGNTGGTQKITRDNFRQDTADAFVADPGTYNLAPINSGTGKIDATYLPTSSDTPKGAWNASTNTPTLADGSGTAGDYYDVTVAGSSDLGSGSITFTVGDVVKYNGTTWFKIDSVTNILDGVSTIDGAKAAIEIPTVGVSPNEVPLSGQLGTMAFQDSAGVSVGQLEAETLTVDSNGSTQPTQSVVTNAGAEGSALELRNSAISASTATALTFTNSTISGANYGKAKIAAVRTNEANGNTDVVISTSASGSLSEAVRIDSSQRVGIGLSNPGDFNSATRDLVVGATTSNHGISIVSGTGSASAISFADSDDSTVGRIQYDHAANSLKFRVNGGEKWSINSTGNLVAGANLGIDFGQATTSAGQGTGTTGTVSNQVLSDYEFGSWVPSFATSGTNFATITTEILAAQYVKVGRYVHCQAYIRTDDVDATGATGGVIVTGLPFVADTSSGNYGQLSVGYSAAWVQAPDTGYIDPNNVIVRLFRSSTTGTSAIVPSDLTSGTTADRNQLIFSLAYIAST